MSLAPHAPDLTLRRMLCQDGPVYRHRSLSGKSSFYFIHSSLSAAIIIRIFFRNTHFSLFQIKRTCTDNFEVNFFMVNHACMTEVITTQWQWWRRTKDDKTPVAGSSTRAHVLLWGGRVQLIDKADIVPLSSFTSHFCFLCLLQMTHHWWVISDQWWIVNKWKQGGHSGLVDCWACSVFIQNLLFKRTSRKLYNT